MTAPSNGDTFKQLRYLAAALKAPRITEAAERLAAQARDAGWTHEDYLAAVLRARLPDPDLQPAFLQSAHVRANSCEVTPKFHRFAVIPAGQPMA
jgi:hypothetical protein